jgi:hypothetical protein
MDVVEESVESIFFVVSSGKYGGCVGAGDYEVYPDVRSIESLLQVLKNKRQKRLGGCLLAVGTSSRSVAKVAF